MRCFTRPPASASTDLSRLYGTVPNEILQFPIELLGELVGPEPVNDSRPRVLGADLVDNAATIFHCRSNKVRAAAARLVPRQVRADEVRLPRAMRGPKEHPLVGPRRQALLVGVHGRLRHTVGPGVQSRTVADLAQAHDARIQLHALDARICRDGQAVAPEAGGAELSRRRLCSELAAFTDPSGHAMVRCMEPRMRTEEDVVSPGQAPQ